MSENNITKEAILQRMYNHAASFWGVKSIDELDPVVRMLMEGLASNLYDTNQNIQDSSIRILESIASALTPGVLISARPAHAIMQALPVESSYYIDPYTAFNENSLIRNY